MSGKALRFGLVAILAGAVAAAIVGASSGAPRSKGQIIIFGPTRAATAFTALQGSPCHAKAEGWT